MKIVSREEVVQENTNIENLGPKSIQVIDLPSKFLPYPEGSKIFYKPYSFNELEMWSNSNTMSKAERFSLGLAGITTVGFDKCDLDFNDYVYIQVLRKLSTFNDTLFNLPYKCPSCELDVVETKNLAELEFSDIKVPKLPVKVILEDKTELSFSVKTINTIMSLPEDLNELEDGKIIHELSSKIINMDYNQAKEIIGNVENGNDINLMAEVYDLLDFGSNTIDCLCPKCETVNIITLSIIYI